MEPKVLSITTQGIWLFAQGEKMFMPHEQFPWFRAASVAAVFDIESVGRGGLRWPALDIDLHIDSIRCPEKYPLIAKQ
jgi:hypothetical protein